MPRSSATCIGAVVSVCCFLTWVEPGVDPDDLQLEARVDRLRTLLEGVDAHHHFGNREGSDVGGAVILRGLGGDLAEDIAALIESRVVGREIRASLVAGAMLELDLRELGGDLHCRIHEAEGGREDQLAAGAGKALDGALGVRAFRDVFEIRRFDLVAEFCLDLLAAEVVGLRITAIGVRTDIDEADLRLVRGLSGGGNADHGGSRSGECECEFLHGDPCWFEVIAEIRL
jgi:hypothetical protein